MSNKDRYGRLYNIWADMKQRCSNKNNTHYSYYGEKGIGYCKEWDKFKAFSEWAINNGYCENLTLDRIDGNKGYAPDNCRWISRHAQSLNRSSKGRKGTNERNIDMLPHGKFRVQIVRNGIKHHIGVFDTISAAITSRNLWVERWRNDHVVI